MDRQRRDAHRRICSSKAVRLPERRKRDDERSDCPRRRRKGILPGVGNDPSGIAALAGPGRGRRGAFRRPSLTAAVSRKATCGAMRFSSVAVSLVVAPHGIEGDTWRGETAGDGPPVGSRFRGLSELERQKPGTASSSGHVAFAPGLASAKQKGRGSAADGSPVLALSGSRASPRPSDNRLVRSEKPHQTSVDGRAPALGILPIRAPHTAGRCTLAFFQPSRPTRCADTRDESTGVQPGEARAVFEESPRLFRMAYLSPPPPTLPAPAFLPSPFSPLFSLCLFFVFSSSLALSRFSPVGLPS